MVKRSQPLRDGANRCVFGSGDMEQSLDPFSMAGYLAAGESESRLALIRQRTHTGRPLGNIEFIHSMEKIAQRRLVPQKRGPREKIVVDRRQGELTFEP